MHQLAIIGLFSLNFCIIIIIENDYSFRLAKVKVTDVVR